MFQPHIFRANDIRGLWKKDFDLAFTKDLAWALCKLCQEKNISSPRFLIGQDARLSSPEISQSLLKHLKNQGAGVSFVDVSPSPLCYFLLSHYHLTACIVVTASHNPPAYNGFKILFHKSLKISSPISSLKKIVLNTKKPTHKNLKGKGYSFSIDKEGPYISSLKKEFPSLKPCPFVIDTGNGALGPLAKKVFKELGLGKTKILFPEPDGHFPNHHPDPTIEQNLFHLKKYLIKSHLEWGIGFDGDGDRLVLVTKKGRVLLGDELGYIFLRSIEKNSLSKNKSRLILADVKCADWFFTAVKKRGFDVLMTKSGHGLIRRELEKSKALMAVEFSGHLFFNDRSDRGFDDALYASLRLLELLNSTNLTKLLPKIPGVRTGEIRLAMSNKKVSLCLSNLKDYLKEKKESFVAIDGLRLSRKNSWALFRSSKTQSALTMRFEAPDLKGMKKLKKEFFKVMGLELPP